MVWIIQWTTQIHKCLEKTDENAIIGLKFEFSIQPFNYKSSHSPTIKFSSEFCIIIAITYWQPFLVLFVNNIKLRWYENALHSADSWFWQTGVNNTNDCGHKIYDWIMHVDWHNDTQIARFVHSECKESDCMCCMHMHNAHQTNYTHTNHSLWIVKFTFTAN